MDSSDESRSSESSSDRQDLKKLAEAAAVGVGRDEYYY